MKKLKIFLPILLISLFFIPRVNASTLLEGKLKLVYNNTTLGYLTEYETKLSNLRTYLQSVNTFTSGGYTFSLDSGRYIVRVQNINTDTLKVWLLDGANTNNYFVSEYTQYNKRIQYYISSFISFNVNFSGNNVVNHDTYTIGNTFFNWNNSYPNECNLYDEVCIANTASYMDTYFYTNTSTIPFNHCTGDNCNEFGFKVNNYTYNPGDNIDLKIVFDNLNPNLNPYVCSIDTSTLGANGGFGNVGNGTVSNVSDFSYNIKANGLTSSDYSIESSFALVSSIPSRIDFNNTASFRIETIKGPTSSGEYNVSGSLYYDNDTNAIRINYVVTALTVEPVTVDAIIKLVPTNTYSKEYFSGKLRIYYCLPNDDNQDKDLNITGGYAYTDDTTGLTNSYDTSLMNFLNNSNNPDLSFFTNIKTILPLGPVDSILTLPLQVLHSISNALSGNCQNVNITLPYVNQNVELKCISNFYNTIGASVFFNSVGTIASTFMLIQYFTFLYNWVDNILRLGHTKVKTWGSGEV